MVSNTDSRLRPPSPLPATSAGGAISKKMELKVLSDSGTQQVFRSIRQSLATLLGDNIDESDLTTMALGLSHSLSRYKLKFSPDKVDTMVVQAIALLDDLDKEINIYAMRVKVISDPRPKTAFTCIRLGADVLCESPSRNGTAGTSPNSARF